MCDPANIASLAGYGNYYGVFCLALCYGYAASRLSEGPKSAHSSYSSFVRSFDPESLAVAGVPGKPVSLGSYGWLSDADVIDTTMTVRSTIRRNVSDCFSSGSESDFFSWDAASCNHHHHHHPEHGSW